MSATSKQILELAKSQIGIKENPRNSNNVKYNTWYYGKPVSGPQYPWCMAFVQWVYTHANAKLPFKTPSCSGLLNWYKRNQPECIVKNPVPGCIVIFDFPNTKYKTDHTGIFVSKNSKTLTTIDGNTSVGNDSNGGEVMARTRDLSNVYAYIVPRELKWKDDEIDMKKEEFLASLTEDDCAEIYSKAMKKISSEEPSEYAVESCKKAVSSGLFTDGDKDGSLDSPKAPVKRQELATVLDRAGLLNKKYNTQ